MISYTQICVNCLSTCCRYACPPITEVRQKIIDDFLKENEVQFPNWLNSTERPYAFPHMAPDGSCIFLDPIQHSCQIHSVKPETCSAGPITFDLDFMQNTISWYIKSSSVCLVASELLSQPSLFQSHLQRAKQALRQLIHDLEPDALQALLEIEESNVQHIGEELLSCS